MTTEEITLSQLGSFLFKSAEALIAKQQRTFKTALMQDLLTGKRRVNALLNEKEVVSI